MMRRNDRPIARARIEPMQMADSVGARVINRVIVAFTLFAAMWFVGQIIRAAMLGRL